MMFTESLIWFRVILLILATISFLPQLLRIRTKQSITGVSPCYILCNLISATEQFTIYFYLLVNEYDPEGGTIFLHTPPSAGDWFSLCHSAVVSLLFLSLYEYPRHLTVDHRVSLCATYVGFLLVSVIPIFIESLWPMEKGLGRAILSAIFGMVHITIFYPIVTALGILAIFCQAREIQKVSFPNVLSVHTLAIQAVVFMLIAVAWIWNLPFDYEEFRGQWGWRTLAMWYSCVGWVIINAFIFGLGQTALVIMALRHPSMANVIQHGETAPLLG
ncbi:hypothetical protein N7463_010020 [Penicillium fimorum]|uniref:Uncharacterized protein n=1 Tax=Penicillium fimorum TaxID=1882269 RepID=A0A9W9XJF0_9EURO|nr:hypothetical protein N7463_010020 [Penicillium fimorum]